MKTAISEVATDYDFILLDCPPSLSLLTLNGLCAADSVLIPMQCEYYALEGLSDLIQTLKKVRSHLNPELEIEGLLRTMYDPRNTLALNVTAELEKHFGEKLYRTIIPRNIRLAEAPSHGIPAFKLEPQSKGALAYLALAGEMLRRIEARELPMTRRQPATAGRGIGISRQAATSRCQDDSTQGTRPRPRRAAVRRQRGRAARSAADARHRPHQAGQVPAAHAHGRDGAERTRRFDPRAGADAADPRASGRRRQLRDHRRRAALARGAARRTHRSAGAGQARAGPVGAGAVADREHPARGPESAGGGHRPAAADRRIRADARSGGQGGRPFAQHRHQPAAADDAGEAGAGIPAQRRHGNGPRARDAGAAGRATGGDGGARGQRQSLGARNGAAGVLAAQSGQAAGAPQRAKVTTPTPRDSKPNSRKSSARK